MEAGASHVKVILPKSIISWHHILPGLPEKRS
jgi:hypothetical protein